MKDLIDRVNKWGIERGLTNAHAQILKACSEWGELCDAVLKRDDAGIRDAIGDIAVCLINYARCADMSQTAIEAVQFPSLVNLGCHILGVLWFEENPHNHAWTEGRNIIAADHIRAALFNLQAVAGQHGTTLRDCLAGSLDIIEKRAGVTTADGVFIKSE